MTNSTPMTNSPSTEITLKTATKCLLKEWTEQKIKVRAKSLELDAEKQKLDAIAEKINDAIELGELDAIKTDKGSYNLGALTISTVQRKTWEYSTYVNNKIKQLQEQEQVEGVATQKITSYNRYVLKDE